MRLFKDEKSLNWDEIKSLYKNQWVVIEAVKAYSKQSKRVLNEISVVESTGDDSRKALEIYKKLHRENKERELYVVHTSRDRLDIGERVNKLRIRLNNEVSEDVKK